MTKVSRSRHIPVVIAVLTALCLVVGELTGKHFQLEWMTGFIPFLTWIMSKTNRDKFISEKSNALRRRKWKEWQFITGLVPAVYPFLSWLHLVVLGRELAALPPETTGALAAAISIVIAARQGGDMNGIGKEKKGKNK